MTRPTPRSCSGPMTVVCWADFHEDCRGLRCDCRCHQPPRTVPLSQWSAADLLGLNDGDDA